MEKTPPKQQIKNKKFENQYSMKDLNFTVLCSIHNGALKSFVCTRTNHKESDLGKLALLESNIKESKLKESKRQIPKGIFPSGNFPNVQFPKRQLPKYVPVAAPQPVLAAALGLHCNLWLPERA